MVTYTVNASPVGGGHCKTIGEAIAMLPEDTEELGMILVKPGIYHEKLRITRSHTVIMGEDAESCVITWDDSARDICEDGKERGTFHSYTVMTDGDDITLSGLTIRNDAKPGENSGQAIALYADGDRLTVNDCRLESFQDTLFTAPLPLTERIPGGFRGPKEKEPRRNTRQLYRNCKISGTVDFIFGGACAWFENCDLISVKLPETEEKPEASLEGDSFCGFVAAASTPEDAEYGYVFHHCRFDGPAEADSVYIGRPWREYAKTVLLDCYLGGHIKGEGFCALDKETVPESCFYAEYGSYGPGAEKGGVMTESEEKMEESKEKSKEESKDKNKKSKTAGKIKRADFAKQLSKEEAEAYTMVSVLGGKDHWIY